MEAGTWLLGAATLAIGSVLSLVVEAIRRRWSREDLAESHRLAAEQERTRRVEERSEAAAQTLLQLLDDLRARFDGCFEHGSGPDSLDDLVVPLRRHAVALNDPSARKNFELIAVAVEQQTGIENMTGDRPTRIAHKVWSVGRETIAAVLQGEPVAVSDDLAAYHSAVEEWWEMNEH